MAFDTEIFDTLSADNEAPKSSSQLAAPKGADQLLVGEYQIASTIALARVLTMRHVARLMRHLAAMATVQEVGPDSYTHSPFSRTLVGRHLQDAIKFMYTSVDALPSKQMCCTDHCQI